MMVSGVFQLVERQPNDLLPLPLVHVPLLLQATGQFIAHGFQRLQSALVLPHLRAGKHRAVQILPCHRLCCGGQLLSSRVRKRPVLWVLHTTAPTSSRMPRMQCTVCISGSTPRSAGSA